MADQHPDTPPAAAPPARPAGPTPSITEAGVYDLPAEAYHADPVVGGSLSNTGAKKLMPPSCPALYRAWADGQLADHSDAMDFGAAAHREVLGIGDDVVVIEGTGKNPNAWATNEDKDAVAAARAAGQRPIKPRDADVIQDMAAALRQHPMAARLLDPGAGQPEQTLVWRDEPSGVWCRALVDHLRPAVPGQRLTLVDYKTAERVDPDSISRALWDYGYYGQAGWYADGAEALGLSTGPPAFVLVVQMKTPPYLVVCAQVHPEAVGWGHARNRKARDLYARCTERGHWPGYADDHVISVTLPPYAKTQLDIRLTAGEFEIEGAVL